MPMQQLKSMVKISYKLSFGQIIHVFHQNQQNKMKANFRIICLKNDESRKYRDDNFKNSNIIVTPNDRKEKSGSEIFIPNLVHLSARLQDDSHEDKRSQYQSYHQESNRFSGKNQLINVETQDISHKKAEQIKRLRKIQIQKFFQEKNQAIQKQKNTMKNLLGSINFSPSKKKQKRISRLIRETINNVCASQRGNRKSKDSQSAALSQNKTLLQSDFHNFLANKQLESSAPVEVNQDIKLKRLSMVNPQQQLVKSARVASVKPLNLFHFLNKKQIADLPNRRQKPRNRSSSNVKASYIDRAINDKKIFNFKSNLKTEEQQFEWSKLKDKNHKHKNFTLRTLDL